MALTFTNTLTRKKEVFQPLENDHVRLYTCGPTVYDFAHIGNFRTYMFEDLLRRYLKYKGYAVTQVMNLTDIDDKTIKGSIAKGITLKEYTKRYIDAFFEDLDSLKIERAEVYPAATEHIEEMVGLIKSLKAKGIAYEVNGNYYYSIAKFPEYGKLSHIDLSGLKAGARVSSDEYDKEAVSDFALWKAWDENDGDVYWETELGKGRPGWHLECSAMSMKYLGKTFDIHCGGVDNIFPHHENEIAQSEAANDQPFVRFWLHSEHLIVEGRKMSKSFNNFYTLRQILEKGYSALAVRYVLISTHYRQQLNFTFEGLDAAANALERYNDFYVNLGDYQGGQSSGEAGSVIDKMIKGFESNLDDDLNISGALGEVFDFIREINRLKAEGRLSAEERTRAREALERIDTVLGFIKKDESDLEAEVMDAIEKRIAARKARDFALADRIRDELLSKGIILEDTPGGTKWKKKI
jgi:cysteinyl-tRNA synthetase